MSNLKTELSHGKSQLYLTGVVKLSDDSFSDVKTSKSGYTYLRTGFSVKVGEERSIWVSMMGGYSQGNPIVYAFNQNNEPIQIPWKTRDNEQVLEQVADYSFYKIAIEKDNNGKLITKKFVSEYDAINYLRDHLKNGMNVIVNANANYSLYKGDVQRSFDIVNLKLDEGYIDGDGIEHEHRQPVARLAQTYLISEDSISDEYEEELRENGLTTVNAYVPQYLSKIDNESIKKTVALPQQFTVRVKDNNLDGAKAVINTLLRPADSGVVREVSMRMDILDGYNTTQISLSEDDLEDEVKQLIEAGLMSMDDINREMYVSGDRVSETTFAAIMLDKKTGKLLKADAYDESVLGLPIVDDEENVSEEEKLLETAVEDDDDFGFDFD